MVIFRFIEKSPEELDGEIEYDVDEEDAIWLEKMNKERSDTGLSVVPIDTLELLIDRLEKESYFQTTNDQGGNVVDADAVCCICLDGNFVCNIFFGVLFFQLELILIFWNILGDATNTNFILFCDRCKF